LVSAQWTTEVAMTSQVDRVAAFHRLHASGCFVMPNPWDAGTARALEQMGFPALATTSAGFAWALGRADNHVTLVEAPSPLHDLDVAVERIRAARQAIDESGTRVVLTGRSEGFVVGRPDIAETVRRLRAYAEAGADCLYAPRITTAEHISAVIDAVSPKPVNLLINSPFMTVHQAAALGVRRISVGGTLARTAWAGFLHSAREIADLGSFSNFQQLPDVDGMFAGP
jgi:2-methylisocitrate lyase-like PEP mutase family enzyme